MIHTLRDFIPKIRHLGDREATRFYNGFRTWKLSYLQLHRQIVTCANFLAQKDIQKGDRLILWGDNEPAWLVVFWASVARGINVIPIDSRSSSGFVKRIQKEVRAKLLVHGDTVDPQSLPLDRLAFCEIQDLPASDVLDLAELSPEDVVEIVYTSGTTGTPKGVVHRHRNLCANLRPFEKEIDRYRSLAFPFQPIRFLNVLPLSHMFGQSAGLFIPILLGGSVVFTSELHPDALVETIRRQRVSVLVTVPRMASQLAGHLERKFGVSSRMSQHAHASVLTRWWRFRDVHSELGWKFWATILGGAQVRSETEDFWSQLGCLVLQGYGLTEASPIVAVNHPFHTKRGSMGRVIEGQEVQIAPDGEILVRGDSVVSEYCSGPRAPGVEKTQDKWLRTGDIGEIDSEGNLFYRGRKKDVIVTSEGFNVFPTDVENVLNRSGFVRESAVVGLERDGQEVVHAVLVLRDRSTEVHQLVSRANLNLEPHQRVRSWSVSAEALPRTLSTMKIKRGQIADTVRTEFSAGKRDLGLEQLRRPGTVDALLARMSGAEVGDLADESRLSEDLGLSSLDLVELLSQLQYQCGVDLDEEDFSRMSTIGEIKQVIEKAEGNTTAKVSALPPPETGTGREATTAPSRRLGSDSRERRRPALPLPHWNHRLPVASLRFLFQNVFALPLFRYYITFSVEGRQHLHGLRPPVLFAANHCSHLDTVAVLAALPFSWRARLAPAMRQEYFMARFRPSGFSVRERLKIAGQYYLACGLFNGYPLPQRMGGIRRALKYSGELVEQKYCPLVFPEGLRSANGQLQPFKSGLALMAMRLRVPVVPIHIQGAFEVFAVHDNWPRTGPVQVRIGAPLRLRGDYHAAARRIESEFRELSRSV